MSNEKTTINFWDKIYGENSSFNRPLSSWYITNRITKHLLGKFIPKNSDVLELGSAPGLWLSWLHLKRNAKITGIDYSTKGIKSQESLFMRLGIDGECRCEDILSTTLKESQFDVVYSLGLIEHYENPRPLIDAHLRLTKPGGLVLIAIPNYTGIHRRLQSYFDPKNLDIHNLELMNRDALRSHIPDEGLATAKIFPFGRFDPGLISFSNRFSPLVSRIIFHCLTLFGHLVPIKIYPWHSMWVIFLEKTDSNR
jgi:SAM-dependent methyltransferase